MTVRKVRLEEPLYTAATVQTPPQARFELAAVLAATHDQLWGNSGETVFQYDFMCELVSVLEEGLLMLNLSCQGEGGSGLTVLIWVLGEMRPHAGGWPGPLLWSVHCQPNDVLMPVSALVVVTVWHKPSSGVLFGEEHSTFL